MLKAEVSMYHMLRQKALSDTLVAVGILLDFITGVWHARARCSLVFVGFCAALMDDVTTEPYPCARYGCSNHPYTFFWYVTSGGADKVFQLEYSRRRPDCLGAFQGQRGESNRCGSQGQRGGVAARWH